MEGLQQQEPKNIIDGDYIEQFLAIDENLQARILQNVLLNHHDMTQAYLQETKELIQLLV